jgi:hypothetical protein
VQEPFRIAPALPPHAMKTYGIAQPAETHWRPAGCGDVDCAPHANGWVTEVDETSTLGQMQAHYIRVESGRRFVESRTAEGFTRFEFEAGQTCFTQHQVPVEREPVFLVRGGDWRGNPLRTSRIHNRPEHWVEDFAEHQGRIAAAMEAG